MFELANNDQIQAWLNDGTATLEMRPLSFLDGVATPNQYSSRAAAVALAVANFDPNSFWAVNKYLFENQPAELTPGPSNEEILAGISGLGIKNFDSVTEAVNDKRFQKWVLNNTTEWKKAEPDKAQHGTPYVAVNGKLYEGTVDNAAEFSQFVTSLLGN
jgi:protein-disulfide isomerase